MKNLLLNIAAFLLLSIPFLSAQQYAKPNRIFKRGQTDLQIGYGLLTTAVLLDKATTVFPPMSIRGDRFLGDNFTLGVSYDYSSHRSKPYLIPDGLEQRITHASHQLSLRPAFHFTSVRNTDIYGGILLGLRFEEFSVDQGPVDYIEQYKRFQPQRTKGAYSAYVGGRYVFCKHWSVFGEVGFCQAVGVVGVGYRM